MVLFLEDPSREPAISTSGRGVEDKGRDQGNPSTMVQNFEPTVRHIGGSN
jgi:hypothetical protein